MNGANLHDETIMTAAANMLESEAERILRKALDEYQDVRQPPPPEVMEAVAKCKLASTGIRRAMAALAVLGITSEES
jgi:hypothetical protein